MGEGFDWNKVIADDEPKQEFPTDGSSALKPVLQDQAEEILKSFEDSDDKQALYRPVQVSEDVHSIKLDDGRFNHEDRIEGLPLQVDADAKPVESAHIDDILRMAI